MSFLCNTLIVHCGSCASKVGASIGFMHLVMPIQAALGAYFFLYFDQHPSMIASGKPYCLVIWSNLLQLGAYLISAAFFIASHFSSDNALFENDQRAVGVAAMPTRTDPALPETVEADVQEMSVQLVQQTHVL